jgi:hypothetical protein
MAGVGSENPVLFKKKKKWKGTRNGNDQLREEESDPMSTNTHGVREMTKEPILFKLLLSSVQ